MKPIRFLYILVIPVFLALACNFPGLGSNKTPTPTGVDLAATITAISIEQTQTAIAAFLNPTNDQAATQANNPTASNPVSTNTPNPTATPTPKPCNAARFIADITIPDDERIDAGSAFTKTWRLENVGTCTWTSGYRLIFSHGDRMGSPNSIQLTGSSIAPGMTVDVSVNLTAPNEGGTYQGFYLLQDAGGANFGINASTKDPFWVKIRVREATSTPEPIADIEVTDFQICNSPKADVPCQISVSVYNNGNKKTGPYTIQFFQSDSAPAGCTWAMDNNARGGQTVSCLYTFPSPYSNIKTRVVADVGNVVPESNESNNTVYKTINVAP